MKITEAAAAVEAQNKVALLSQANNQIGQIEGQIVNVIGAFSTVKASSPDADDQTELDARFDDMTTTSAARFKSSLDADGYALLKAYWTAVFAKYEA